MKKPNYDLSERDIQGQIIDWLKVRRIFYWRANTGAMHAKHNGKSRFVRFGRLGQPDLFALRDGTLYGIEVKAASGEQSPKQIEFSVEFTRAGGHYILAYSLEDAIKGIE